MKVSLEYLYHFCCDRCHQWWSRADIEPQAGEVTYCPYCGHANVVEGIQTFRDAAYRAERQSCLRVKADP